MRLPQKSKTKQISYFSVEEKAFPYNVSREHTGDAESVMKKFSIHFRSHRVSPQLLGPISHTWPNDTFPVSTNYCLSAHLIHHIFPISFAPLLIFYLSLYMSLKTHDTILSCLTSQFSLKQLYLFFNTQDTLQNIPSLSKNMRLSATLRTRCCLADSRLRL